MKKHFIILAAVLAVVSCSGKFVAKGGDFIQEREDINAMVQRKEMADATKAGARFTDIAGKTADGKEIKLSEFVGKGRKRTGNRQVYEHDMASHLR